MEKTKKHKKKVTKSVMGRPPKYSPLTLKKTRDYLHECREYYETRMRPGVVDNKVIDETYIYHNIRVPTIEGLAYELEINTDTINEWKKIYPDFSVLIARLKVMQADKLVNGGLTGTYNSNIAKVLLVKHGYRDAQEVTGLEGGAIQMESTVNQEKLLALFGHGPESSS